MRPQRTIGVWVLAVGLGLWLASAVFAWPGMLGADRSSPAAAPVLLDAETPTPTPTPEPITVEVLSFPATVVYGGSATILWRVDGAPSFGHNNVHYGPDSCPTTHCYPMETASQGGGPGQYSDVITNIIQRLYFRVHASAGLDNTAESPEYFIEVSGTATPTATATDTPVPSATSTPTATTTNTPTATGTSTPTQLPPTSSTPITRKFTGIIYRGTKPSTTTRQPGILVQVYGSNTINAQGALLRGFVTTDEGYFELPWAAGDFAYYNIIVNASDYQAVGAQSGPGGVVRANHWIQYANPPAGTLAGNAFWVMPLVTPSATATTTPTPTDTATLTPTATPTDTATPIATATPTATETSTATSTATPTVTPTATATPSPTRTPRVEPGTTFLPLLLKEVAFCLAAEQEPNNGLLEASSKPPLCRDTLVAGTLPEGDRDDYYWLRVDRDSVLVIDLTDWTLAKIALRTQKTGRLLIG